MSDNHQGLEQLKQQIKEFIKQDTPEIFALTGTWGVGKTFALKNVIDELKKEDNTKKYLDDYAYVSLFGLRNIDDVKSKIFTTFYSMAEKGGYFSKVLENFSCDYENNGNKFSLGGLIGGAVSLGKDILIEKILSNKIICFDDFERTSIDTQELLGFLQDLKEERNCKIILIYNQEKLDNRKKDFDKYREKVIDQHFDYTPSSTQTVELAFKPFTNIENYQAFIAEKCEALKLNNIRIIQKILKHINKDIHESLEKVTWSHEIYSDIRKDVTEHIISSIILYAFLYFQGNYKEKDLEISKEDFEKHFKFLNLNKNNTVDEMLDFYDQQSAFGSEAIDNVDGKKLGEDSKKKEIALKNWKEKQEYFSNFIGEDFAFYAWIEQQSEIQEISKHIIQLIKAGYLLDNQKNDLKESLKKFNNSKANNIDRNKKRNAWSSTARERHNKLVDDNYPQRFYQTAKDVVSFETMNNVDFMVHFLKEHNMLTEAQEIIDLFINHSKDYGNFVLNRHNLFPLDIEKMDSDFKEACEKKIKELHDIELNQISLKRALAKTDINGDCIYGYYEKKVANASKDDIKKLLLGLNENLSKFGNCLIAINTKNAILAFYEVYQEADETRKIQIRADEIFGDVLKETLKRTDLDTHIKTMIDEILSTPTAPIGASQ